jgi:hypothetical protein
MRAEITGIKRPTSKKTGELIYLMFFRNEDGSYHTYIDPANRNFSNWKDIIKRVQAGELRIVLEGLDIKTGKLINADSNVREVLGANNPKRNTAAKKEPEDKLPKSGKASKPSQQTLF